MSNRHGSIPGVESLRIYLEYHAMLCAGDMIDESIPIAVDTYEDAGCPWQEWIQSHLNVGSDYWLSDLLSTTHIDQIVLRIDISQSVSEKHDSQILNSALGLTENTRNGYIVVHGYISLYAPQSHGYIRVTSALVTSETARSLHALQSTNPHNFQLPVIWNSCELRDANQMVE